MKPKKKMSEKIFVIPAQKMQSPANMAFLVALFLMVKHHNTIKALWLGGCA
jgi:hypothetical protein